MNIDYRVRVPITDVTMDLTFPVNTFFSTEPIVHVTIEGAATNVAITRNSTLLGSFGYVYTSLTLGFDAGAVGKYVNVSVHGE